MRFVRLTPLERDFLKSADFLPQDLRATVLEQVSQLEAGVVEGLSVGDTVAERLRDAFTEHLARAGFDADYELNAKGEILERLIDAFV